MALNTGCRRGELLKLRDDMVKLRDLGNERIELPGAICKSGKGRDVPEPRRDRRTQSLAGSAEDAESAERGRSVVPWEAAVLGRSVEPARIPAPLRRGRDRGSDLPRSAPHLRLAARPRRDASHGGAEDAGPQLDRRDGIALRLSGPKRGEGRSAGVPCLLIRRRHSGSGSRPMARKNKETGGAATGPSVGALALAGADTRRFEYDRGTIDAFTAVVDALEAHPTRTARELLDDPALMFKAAKVAVEKRRAS